MATIRLVSIKYGDSRLDIRRCEINAIKNSNVWRYNEKIKSLIDYSHTERNNNIHNISAQ